MPYITETYVNEAFGADEVAALCPSPAELARVIEMAEAETETALLNGGYPNAVPSSVYATLDDCPKAIRLLAYGAFIEAAHGRKRVPIPTDYLEYVRKLDLVRSGRMQLPGVDKGGTDKDVTRVPGGIASTETSPSVEGSRPPVFDRDSFRRGGF